MKRNTSSRYDQTPTQPFPFVEARWQFPLQYTKVSSKLPVNTLSNEMGKESWWIVLDQFLILSLHWKENHDGLQS